MASDKKVERLKQKRKRVAKRIKKQHDKADSTRTH